MSCVLEFDFYVVATGNFVIVCQLWHRIVSHHDCELYIPLLFHFVHAYAASYAFDGQSQKIDFF